MSLILEALRRSEAERQRGQAPGLFVEQQARRQRRRAPQPAWMWALPVIVTLLVVLVWSQWPAAPGDGAASTAPAPVLATADASAATDAPALAEPAIAPADRGTEPALATLPPAAPEPVATVDTRQAPSPAPAGPAPAPAAPAAATVPAAVPATTAEAVQAASTVAPAPAPALEPLPRLADLPAGERAALPPLRLSMHVFSEDPGRRFVIVDERRFGEGGSPAPGLVIEEIRRDGAVLSVDGRRVLLPRP